MQVQDIEDLKRAGAEMEACPYYAARLRAKTAEVLFVPFNYVLDPVIRRNVELELRVCRQAVSCSLAATCLHAARHGWPRV